MQYLLGLIILGLLPIIGFYVGAKVAQSRGDDKKLTNPEKKELARLREFEADVLGLAHEHLAYGDPLAPLIIDKGRGRLS